jgi:hypothetical protein
LRRQGIAHESAAKTGRANRAISCDRNRAETLRLVGVDNRPDESCVGLGRHHKNYYDDKNTCCQGENFIPLARFHFGHGQCSNFFAADIR